MNWGKTQSIHTKFLAELSKLKKMNKIIITLDASQIYEYQMCPLKWYYRYKENLQLSGIRMTAPDKGTLIHHLLDFYYNLRWKDPNGNKLQQAQIAVDKFKERALVQELFPEYKGELERFLCERFFFYVQRYINDDFILPSTETSPIELGFSKLLYEDEKAMFIVEGRIDLVNIIDGNKLCWTDHKTQDRKSELYKYKPQFKTYAWATGYNYGIINYFGLQDKYVEGNTFRRDLIYSPDQMIKEWEQKMLGIFRDIYSLACDEILNESVLYHRRNDSYCAGAFDCNPCQFTHLCEETNWEIKQNIKNFKYNKQEAWSPWKLKEEVK